LARHALNSLGAEVLWGKEEYRNAVFIDRDKVAPTNMHPMVAQEDE
jgi:hypothetical protein